MGIKVERIDHLVLTCKDLTSTLEFYVKVLGMKEEKFANGRLALHFGNQKINIHQEGNEIKPHATKTFPGTSDLCFVVDEEIDEILAILHQNAIDVELGPVQRVGAIGKIYSIYLRDPDGNLIELSTYTPSRTTHHKTSKKYL